MPQSTKRRPESTLEPTTSKRAREHTDSKQPQRAASHASKHAKPNVSQPSADDTGVVRPGHKPAGPAPQLAESSPEPVVSVGTRTKDASWVSQEKAQEDARATCEYWESLEDDTFFFLLSRIECALKDRLSSKKNASWMKRNPEAPEMSSSLNNIL
jgi:hypothetical protein